MDPELKSDLKKGRKIAVWVIGSVLLIGSALSVLGYVGGWFAEAAQVAQEEFGPRAAVDKYEWFKQAYANLEKKKADIELAKSQSASLQHQYTDIPKPRDVREEIARLEQTVTDLTLSYNRLASEYNAKSSMFTWSEFEGDAPQTVKHYNVDAM